jgi:hypothetical protein
VGLSVPGLEVFIVDNLAKPCRRLIITLHGNQKVNIVLTVIGL